MLIVTKRQSWQEKYVFFIKYHIEKQQENSRDDGVINMNDDCAIEDNIQKNTNRHILYVLHLRSYWSIWEAARNAISEKSKIKIDWEITYMYIASIGLCKLGEKVLFEIVFERVERQ